MMESIVEGFEGGAFEHGGTTHPVFRRGQGPGVIVIHEIPGITPEVARFARLVADAGFTVLVPALFGTVGRPLTIGYSLTQLARACVSREFRVLAARDSSPLTDWLRALARSLHAELGGAGVGAVGMCITGNFALAMSVDPEMMAPVLSQPSLPFPLGAERRAGLHVSDAALGTIQQRCLAGDLRVLGLRFTADRTVPAERFERLRHELGEAFEAIEIDSSPGNAAQLSPRTHSVLTAELVDREGHPTRAALDRVLAFLKEQLGTDAAASAG